jgi:hypothetical protein
MIIDDIETINNQDPTPAADNVFIILADSTQCLYPPSMTGVATGYGEASASPTIPGPYRNKWTGRRVVGYCTPAGQAATITFQVLDGSSWITDINAPGTLGVKAILSNQRYPFDYAPDGEFRIILTWTTKPTALDCFVELIRDRAIA